MVDKTPIRLVLDNSNNPTGLAEFQSGETIGNSFLTNSSFILADDSSSTTNISLGETLRILGGTGLSSTISGDTVSVNLDNTSVTPNTYGSSTAIPVLTIDQQGRITSATTNNISTTLTIADDSSTTTNIALGTDTLKISGDTGITASISGDTVSIDLDDTAVAPNTYGSSTAIPVLAIDQQGRITSASTQNISTTLTISDDASSLVNINLGSDTLKISGTSNEIETIISGDTLTIGLPNDVTIGNNLTVTGSITSGNLLPPTDNAGAVGTNDLTWNNGQFTNLTIDNVLTVRTAIDLADGDILRFGTNDDWEMFHDGTANRIDLNVGDLTIRDDGTAGDPVRFTFGRTTGNFTTTGDITVGGNLTVNGTTTTISTANTVVSDQLFELGNGRTGAATGDAGIVIERGDDDNIFIGYDESADVVTFASGSFTGASTGNLTLTESNIKAADITSTGNLDIAGSSTLRGNITLGVNSGDSTEDTITVNARFVSNLEPLDNITYDLGSPNRRWRDLYLSGNTIDLNGATISGDGSGNITISAAGAILPEGSSVGNQSIATADPNTGISTRFVPLFTQTSGLSTAAINLIFKSGNETGQLVFTDFIVSNGQNVATFNSGGTLFAF